MIQGGDFDGGRFVFSISWVESSILHRIKSAKVFHWSALSMRTNRLAAPRDLLNKKRSRGPARPGVPNFCRAVPARESARDRVLPEEAQIMQQTPCVLRARNMEMLFPAKSERASVRRRRGKRATYKPPVPAPIDTNTAPLHSPPTAHSLPLFSLPPSLSPSILTNKQPAK